MPAPMFSPQPANATAVLVLADGTTWWGQGTGTEGTTVAEICFNTAMSGYQEVLTDPSYAQQIITFTMPHIGNTGTNFEDVEADAPLAKGFILRDAITEPSNWRADASLTDWASQHGLIGLTGTDTRALTQHIRTHGAQNAALCHNSQGKFDLPALWEKAKTWQGLDGMDLTLEATRGLPSSWRQTGWSWPNGYSETTETGPHIVVVDYGVKNNILRLLAQRHCHVSVVPADATAENILSLNPDGILLGNGPGDPHAATHAIAAIESLLEANLPIFGICLGHQMLALALGAKTEKMRNGHRGANHPIKVLGTGQIDITSQNHGFVVSDSNLPEHVEVTHRSLFDGTIAGLKVKGRPIFSVQYHPEASPGPKDAAHLFDQFVTLAKDQRLAKAS